MLGQIDHGTDIYQATQTGCCIYQKPRSIAAGLRKLALQSVIGGNAYVIQIAEKIGDAMMSETGHYPVVTLGNRFHHIGIQAIVKGLRAPIPALPRIFRVIAMSRGAGVKQTYHCQNQNRIEFLVFVILHINYLYVLNTLKQTKSRVT